MTSSMPSPIDEFSEEFYVDASSWIHEGDEGTLRKPALLLINSKWNILQKNQREFHRIIMILCFNYNWIDRITIL